MSKYCDPLERHNIRNAEFLCKTSYETKTISMQLLNDFELFIVI